MNIEKINKFIETSAQLEELGLIILEKSNITSVATVGVALQKMGYKRAKDYLEVMEFLESKTPVFYIEPKEKLNNLVWDTVRQYGDGMITMMDRKNHTGLKTVHFLPKTSPFVLVLTREQAENSPGKLFEYTGGAESI